MNTSRRTFLAGGATLGLAMTAGCLEFVTGDAPLEFDAQRVAPSEATLAETGYNKQSIDQETIEETVDIGVEREIRAAFWLSTYTNELDYQGESREAGLFAAVSLPGMSILGQSFNPLEDMSHEELLDEFLAEAGEDDIENIEHDESFSLQILEADREVDLFVGETEMDGETVEVTIAVTSFEHEDDFIVLLGSYPDLLADEGPNIEVLMESIEHPA